MALGLKKKSNALKNSLHGLKYAIKEEFSVNLIIGVAIIWIGLGIFFQISLLKWIFTILLLGLMLAFELMNTSIETVVDLISPDIHPLAKIAKDTGSAAEGVFAVFSMISFCLIFIPEILNYMMW